MAVQKILDWVLGFHFVSVVAPCNFNVHVGKDIFLEVLSVVNAECELEYSCHALSANITVLRA